MILRVYEYKVSFRGQVYRAKFRGVSEEDAREQMENHYDMAFGGKPEVISVRELEGLKVEI